MVIWAAQTKESWKLAGQLIWHIQWWTRNPISNKVRGEDWQLSIPWLLQYVTACPQSQTYTCMHTHLHFLELIFFLFFDFFYLIHFASSLLPSPVPAATNLLPPHRFLLWECGKPIGIPPIQVLQDSVRLDKTTQLVEHILRAGNSWGSTLHLSEWLRLKVQR